ncbi:Putative sulfate transporter ychM [Eikenella corrodens]|uniref:Sulfate permease n=2 Tax=Eikenella corrodens TaxID=539 RepID=C0DXL7_EIKCO|nr:MULTISPECIES: SulP family inorganic anion transporter [Eikenella]EEG23198.1 sulfate permease [Eikenella corrodens ATCC 23834]OAM20122.1 sodium-independent anion transporter [Eikenella corrodens]OFN62571.1 sodium-independent anion transporter [Eikenella sp. HMSC061C02]OWP28009.1 sodium-independent anion transporter [Eikenella corrodens]UAK74537.1 STAS domain-containing protein [Eikenella corrodens]
MIAWMEARRAGLLGRAHWANNIVAGIIVGVVALPLSMAFAIATGVKPEQGIYTAIVASVIVAVAGGSRVQIAGPTGAFIAILSGITAKFGFDGLQIATLLAGIILLFMGLFRFGGMIRFISMPVIMGFTAGIGVVIFVGQWAAFFGLPKAGGEHFHQQLWSLLQSLPHLHPTTTALGLFSLALLLLMPKVPLLRRLPSPMWVLLCATVLQSLFHFEGVATVGSAYGAIPRALPHFSLPNFATAETAKLILPAFTIAMLGAIESLLSAVVADGMAGTHHSANQELVGQGLANIITPFFGGFAATGAIARTATNIRQGGNSPLAGIIHALTLALILLVAAPLAADIPLAALAAILFQVAWNMSEPKRCLHILRRAQRAAYILFFITFSLTILVDLVVAVNIGVILSTLHFIGQMAKAVEVRKEEHSRDAAALPDNVLMFIVNGPFFFGAMEKFETTLADINTQPRAVVLRMRWVPYIDITGILTLERVISGLQKRGIRVIVTGANEQVRASLERSGIVTLLGKGNFIREFDDAAAMLRAGSKAGAAS